MIEVDDVGAAQSDGQPESPAAGEPAQGEGAAQGEEPEAQAQGPAADDPQAGGEPAAPGDET